MNQSNKRAHRSEAESIGGTEETAKSEATTTSEAQRFEASSCVFSLSLCRSYLLIHMSSSVFCLVFRLSCVYLGVALSYLVSGLVVSCRVLSCLVLSCLVYTIVEFVCIDVFFLFTLRLGGEGGG